MNNVCNVKINNLGRFTDEKNLNKKILDEALENALKKIDFLHSTIGENFAKSNSKNNVYSYDDYTGNDWNLGFTTGLYWLAYEATGDDKYKDWALAQIPGLYKKIDEKINVNHHDMGFLYIPSCVASYKLTGCQQGKEAAIKGLDI